MSLNEHRALEGHSVESSNSGMSGNKLSLSFMNQTVSTISPLQYRVNILNMEDEE